MLATATELAVNGTTPRTWFTLLLNNVSAAIADKHVPMYVAKGLLRKYDTLTDLAAGLGVDIKTLQLTATQYQIQAKAGYVPIQ